MNREIQTNSNGMITVACLGSSTTAAKGTFDWLAEIKKRPENKRFRFINLGVGGDLSYNALLRVGRVIDAKPDIVLILIGANDILAMVFENVYRLYKRWKYLPQRPSTEWFRQNLLAIVQRIKSGTNAQIALASPALIGEAPDSGDSKQNELNRYFAEFAEVIKDISRKENLIYIPFYEKFLEQIKSAPGRPFAHFSFLSFYRDYLFREFILGYSFDKIAGLNGWKFHIDGVHLNTSGGLILTEAVQYYLNTRDEPAIISE